MADKVELIDLPRIHTFNLLTPAWGMDGRVNVNRGEIAHARAGEITHDAQNGGMFAAVFGFRIVIDFVGVGWPSTGLFGAFGRTRLQRLIDQSQYERMKLVQANPVAATSTEIKRAA